MGYIRALIVVLGISLAVLLGIMYVTVPKPIDPHFSVVAVEEPFIPTTISIPAIKVETTVESVKMNSKKEMEAPKNYDNTAWYSLGYYPYDKGNVVISGHLDKTDGSPAVFWNLQKLKAGDEIIVKSQSKQAVYIVESTEEVLANNFPISKVFGPSDDQRLNLITCDGSYTKGVGYNKRFVVYSKIKDVNK